MCKKVVVTTFFQLKCVDRVSRLIWVAVSSAHGRWKNLKVWLRLTCDGDGNGTVPVEQTVVMSRLTALTVALRVRNSLASWETVSFSKKLLPFEVGTNYNLYSATPLFTSKRGAVYWRSTVLFEAALGLILVCRVAAQRDSTVGRTPQDEWSARRRDLYLYITQHSRQTDIHAPGGIRTHNISRPTVADPRLRQRSHRNRRIWSIFNDIYI